MRQRKKKAKSLFTTSEVARILGLDQWRVKNFTEGVAYGLPPAVRAGQGRGSRRLYEWPDICRMLIASELVSLGFSPEAVGKAVREIAESKLVGRNYSDPSCEILVQSNSGWDVVPPSILNRYSKSNSLIVVPFQQLILNLKDEIRTREEDEFMQREFPEVWKEISGEEN